MKAHGIHPSHNSGSSTVPDSPGTATSRSRASASTTPKSTKRKVDQLEDSNGHGATGDEGVPTATKTKGKKMKAKAGSVAADAGLGESTAQDIDGANDDGAVFKASLASEEVKGSHHGLQNGFTPINAQDDVSSKVI